MHGRVRHDGPNARLKFTRDWEYPWTFLAAEAGPGRRILDCGAGYSPLPFLWARRGAAVQALDRDAVVASRAAYAWWCLRQGWNDLVRDVGRSATDGAEAPRLGTSAASGRVDRGSGLEARGETASSAEPSDAAAKRRPSPLSRFVRYHVRRNRERLRRLVKPDFWGPVSPRLLKQYAVAYTQGDLTALPFDASYFDVVTCVSVLEHMPRAARLQGLRDMARVLRPGGRLVLTYDLVDGDITQELVDASGCTARELVYFDASARLFAPGAPDVVGIILEKR